MDKVWSTSEVFIDLPLSCLRGNISYKIHVLISPGYSEETEGPRDWRKPVSARLREGRWQWEINPSAGHLHW